MNDGALVAHQLRYDLLVNWRNPQSRFFTIVLPVIFLVLLTSLFGNHTTDVNGTPIKNSTFYGLSSPFGGDSSVRERDRDAGAAEVDHRDQGVGGVESVGPV